MLYFFLLFLVGFLTVYILRGIGILTFLPGGIILSLLVLAIATGIIWGIRATKNF